MHPMIRKYIDQNFMTEEQGQYINDAIMRKESIVISGHRSAGIRPLMAAMMAIAKANFSNIQVKDFADLEKETEFFLIPASDSVDFEKLIGAAMAVDETPFISIKEPEHPVSLLKLFKSNYKQGKGINQKIHSLECKKENDVPYLDKITEMYIDDKGKVSKTDF